MSSEKQSFKKSINMRLVGAINEIENPTNTVENPFHKSKYVPLSDIIAIAKPVLKKHGLAIIQQPETEYHDEHGNPLQGVGVKIRNIMISEEGEEKHFPPILFVSQDTRPQAIGSTITYAKRYSLASILGVAGKEEDDDGNQASQHSQQPAQAQQPVFINKNQVEELRGIAEKTADIGGVETEQILKVIGKPLEDVQTNQFKQVKSTFEKLLKRAEEKAKEKGQAEGEKEEKASEKKAEENPTSEKGTTSTSLDFVVKSTEEGTAPSGVDYLKIVSQDGEVLMANKEAIVDSLKELKVGDAVGVEVVSKNGFTLIEKVNSVEKAS